MQQEFGNASSDGTSRHVKCVLRVNKSTMEYRTLFHILTMTGNLSIIANHVLGVMMAYYLLFVNIIPYHVFHLSKTEVWWSEA